MAGLRIIVVGGKLESGFRYVIYRLKHNIGNMLALIREVDIYPPPILKQLPEVGDLYLTNARLDVYRVGGRTVGSLWSWGSNSRDCPTFAWGDFFLRKSFQAEEEEWTNLGNKFGVEIDFCPLNGPVFRPDLFPRFNEKPTDYFSEKAVGE